MPYPPLRDKKSPSWKFDTASAYRNTAAGLVCFESEIQALGLTRSDGDLLRHRAQFFVPGFHRVVSRRQVRQLEAAILTCHREVGVLEHSDIALHPRMHVALHRDRNFFPRKALFHG